MYQIYWKRFCKHRLGLFALAVFLLFCFVGIYAPFFASSKPIFVRWNNESYFPLFRYLFYSGFFSKRLDIFFNLMMFTTPLLILVSLTSWRKPLILSVIALQFGLFFYCISGTIKDPASNPQLNEERQGIIQEKRQKGAVLPDWNFDLKYMTTYAKLNLIINDYLLNRQHERIGIHKAYTLWQIRQNNQQDELLRQEKTMQSQPEGSLAYQMAHARHQYILDKNAWLEKQSISNLIMPLIRDFHWEDDAGGEQSLNQTASWWELTRINRKDLVAALIFGIRISLVVGITAVFIALIIGIPIGALAGYYGGKFDIVTSRMLEIWEAMPTFFMLLLVVAITQSKSIFLVIFVIGIFGWTSFSRYIRAEFFKQRNLSYVEACHAMGFSDSRIIFSHILPNAIPPILTLVPFAMMAAITSEAGLSFLGLGEEGSASWGVLMDEGRTAFPGESYLLWPPAVLLVILLVAIALVGDALRDTLDPKMRV